MSYSKTTWHGKKISGILRRKDILTKGIFREIVCQVHTTRLYTNQGVLFGQTVPTHGYGFTSYGSHELLLQARLLHLGPRILD